MINERYYEHRTKGRPVNRLARAGRLTLTEMLQTAVSPKILKIIDNLIEDGLFANRSEFIRHIIVEYFENNREWIR